MLSIQRENNQQDDLKSNEESVKDIKEEMENEEIDLKFGSSIEVNSQLNLTDLEVKSEIEDEDSMDINEILAKVIEEYQKEETKSEDETSKRIETHKIRILQNNYVSDENSNRQVVQKIKQKFESEKFKSTCGSSIDINSQLYRTNQETKTDIKIENENEDVYSIDINEGFAKINDVYEREDTESEDETTERITVATKGVVQTRKRKNRKQTFPKRKRKRLYQELSGPDSPFVYTTRLEEMNIMHYYFLYKETTHIFNEIVKESKPTYKIRSQNVMYSSKAKERKKVSFSTLQQLVRNLKPTRSISVQPDLNYNEQTHSYVSIEDDPKDYLNNTKDAIILINNLTSNLSDVYITDSKGRVHEYYTGKSDERRIKNVLKKSNSFKKRINICCWYNRRDKIGAIFPKVSSSFSRFLKAKHGCPPDACKCCCRLEVTTSDSLAEKRKSKFMSSLKNIRVQPINLSSFRLRKTININDKITNKALLNKNEERDTSADKNVSPVSQPEDINCNNNIICYEFVDNYLPIRTGRREFIEIEKCNKRVLAQKAHSSRESANVTRINVCCRTKRNLFLLYQYKKSMISTSTLQYLKIAIPLEICKKCEKIIKKVDMPLKSKINLPNVSHTRQSFKCKLGLAEHPLNDQNIEHDVNNESNKATKIPLLRALLAQDCASKTILLIVSCIQIPSIEILIRNLAYDMAVQLIVLLSATTVTVRDNRELVASFVSSVESSPAHNLNILHEVLKLLQNQVNIMSSTQPCLLAGSKLNLTTKMQTIDNMRTSIAQGAGPTNENFVVCATNTSEKVVDQNNTNPRDLTNTPIKSTTNYNIIKKSPTKNSVKPLSEKVVRSANKSTLTALNPYVDLTDSNTHPTSSQKNFTAETAKTPSESDDSSNVLQEFEDEIPFTVVERNSKRITEISNNINLLSNKHGESPTYTSNAKRADIQDEQAFNIFDRFASSLKKNKESYVKSFNNYLIGSTFNHTYSVEKIVPRISDVFSLNTRNANDNRPSQNYSGHRPNIVASNISSSKTTNDRILDITEPTLTDTNARPKKNSRHRPNILTSNVSRSKTTHVLDRILESTEPTITDTKARPRNFPRQKSNILGSKVSSSKTTNMPYMILDSTAPTTDTNDVILQPADKQRQKSQLSDKMPDLIRDIPESSDLDNVINIADDIFVKEEDVMFLDSE